MLLKSSDFINHDLNHAYENCIDKEEKEDKRIQYDLVLRKWYDLQPSMEFRCFVKNQEIIGITQRDVNYYSFLKDIESDIEHSIYQFFDDVVRDGFDSVHCKVFNSWRGYSSNIHSFFYEIDVFDVYLQRSNNKVYLVDFNPFNPTTDALLYNWDELMSCNIQEFFAQILYV